MSEAAPVLEWPVGCREYLESRGVPLDRAEAAGLTPVPHDELVDAVGGSGLAADAVAIGIPLTPSGMLYRVIPPATRRDRGGKLKECKFLTPAGQRQAVFIPPGVAEHLAANPDAQPIKTEGPIKALAATINGIFTVGLNGVYGFTAGKDAADQSVNELHPALIPLVQGRTVVMVVDSDLDTQQHRIDKTLPRVLHKLHGQAIRAGATGVRYVILPAGADGRKLGLDDALVAMGADAVRGLLEGAREYRPPEDAGVPAGSSLRDMIVLPSNAGESISSAAEQLYQRMAPGHKLFRRGGRVVKRVSSPDGDTLEIIDPDQFRSLIEGYGPLMTHRKYGDDGRTALVSTLCSKDTAAALLACDEMRHLPEIVGLSAAPLIVPDREAGARVLSRGYDTETGWFVTNGLPPEVMSVEKAVPIVSELFNEYSFATPADRSRATAALMEPPLRLGGWFQGNAVALIPEADDSQAGKGHMLDSVGAVYGERCSLVTLKSGGVGGLDESIGQAMLSGKPFIRLDNLRGRMDSQYLEATLTAPGCVGVRVPHKGEIQVDPRRFVFTATSNGLESTRDLANRSLMIRIRKREGYNFRKYPEGGLLQHIKAHQPRYLGAVFAIIKDWAAKGRQRSDEVRHDFRECIQILDHIVQHYFGGARIMDGHQDAQIRISNPALGWLRAVGLAARMEGMWDQDLNASAVAELCEEHGIELPGLRPDGGDHIRAKRVGILMKRAFGDKTEVAVDEIAVSRVEREEFNTAAGKTRTAKFYRFGAAASDGSGGGPALAEPPAKISPDPTTLYENPIFLETIAVSGKVAAASISPAQPPAPPPPGEEFPVTDFHDTATGPASEEDLVPMLPFNPNQFL